MSEPNFSPQLQAAARKLSFGVGFGLIAFGFLVEASNHGEILTKCGPTNTLFLVLGILYLALAWRARSARALHLLFQCSIALAVLYGFLAPMNFISDRLIRYQLVHGDFSWRSVHEPGRDPFTRKMQPNIDRSFLYNGGRVHLKTNSLGHRDDELNFRPGARNLVLTGDSFTFGFGIDQEDKIDRQIERLAQADGKNYDAYNIAYAGSCAINSYNELMHFNPKGATDYIYVFHHNDVFEIATPPHAFHVYKGVIFDELKEDGTPHTEADFEQGIRQQALNVQHPIPTPGRYVADLLSLMRLRKAMDPRLIRQWLLDRRTAVLHVMPTLESRSAQRSLERLPDCSAPPAYAEKWKQGVAMTIEYSQKMEKIAKDRGAKFHVAFTPAGVEVDGGGYEPQTQAVICGLKKLGFDVFDQAILYLLPEDYIQADGHFNARGAAIAGQVFYADLAGKSLPATHLAGPVPKR